VRGVSLGEPCEAPRLLFCRLLGIPFEPPRLLRPRQRERRYVYVPCIGLLDMRPYREKLTDEEEDQLVL
jgi:hypothetical protein